MNMLQNMIQDTVTLLEKNYQYIQITSL